MILTLAKDQFIDALDDDYMKLRIQQLRLQNPAAILGVCSGPGVTQLDRQAKGLTCLGNSLRVIPGAKTHYYPGVHQGVQEDCWVPVARSWHSTWEEGPVKGHLLELGPLPSGMHKAVTAGAVFEACWWWI